MNEISACQVRDTRSSVPGQSSPQVTVMCARVSAVLRCGGQCPVITAQRMQWPRMCKSQRAACSDLA
eukprot:7388473-Prymnesium_polylepis.2